ncbi:hypothetical protein FBU31_003268 [Coemansia sp. 'formosensis']|nr:hypothetical protein FBU31_003268 [Coemansia sp. 'formosensis']
MAHINDLPAAVLTQILFKATAISAKTLSEWKANLPLVAVCRAWTELAQPFVFYHVYVELTSSLWLDILPFAYSNTRSFWTSNAELIISRGRVLMARRLAIQLAENLTHGCLKSIALEILRLDRVDWQHINALAISSGPSVRQYYRYAADTEEASDADIARTVQYFGRNVRNVVEINLDSKDRDPQCNYFCARLAATYGRQLQIHRACYLFPVSFLNFSRHIKVLELNLGSLASSVLTGICGETLGVLQLYAVPRNFAWHHFRYDTFDQPIVFRQLTILHLNYQSEDESKVLTADEVQEKTSLGARNCDRLRFPALSEMSIVNCTPDCDLLYADLPFPELKSVALSGSIESIHHCCRLKLTWVHGLDVLIFPHSSGTSTEIYRATNHLFSNICIGRTATLYLVTVDWFVLDADQMRWINLTKLVVQRVDYATICKAIGRLPNLCELTILYLVFGDMAVDDFSAHPSLFISADPLLAWGMKLETANILSFGNDYFLTVVIGTIQDFIQHAGELKNLVVPKFARQPVAAFIDVYKDRYPHLADIQVLDD